jgi:hypothetical protein
MPPCLILAQSCLLSGYIYNESYTRHSFTGMNMNLINREVECLKMVNKYSLCYTAFKLNKFAS